jgi:hypothetical protein
VETSRNLDCYFLRFALAVRFFCFEVCGGGVDNIRLRTSSNFIPFIEMLASFGMSETNHKTKTLASQN